MDTAKSYEFLSNEEDYNETFHYFSRGRQQQQKVWIVNELFPRIENIKNCEETCKVLSVGPGDGAVDFLLLEEFIKIANKVQGKISWTVVEPNLTSMEKFKLKVKQRQTSFKDVEFQWINQTFDEFLGSDKWDSESKKFHLIHFVHCLYYMEEKSVIQAVMEKLLLPEGYMVVVVGTENDVWEMLLKEYKSKVDTLSTELHYLTNKAIIKHLEGNDKWKYVTFAGKLDLEITEIFEKDHHGGIALLQFFLHTKEDPRKSVKSELIEEIVQFFRGISWSKKTEDKEKFYVCDDEGVVIISHN